MDDLIQNIHGNELSRCNSDSCIGCGIINCLWLSSFVVVLFLDVFICISIHAVYCSLWERMHEISKHFI